MKTLVVLSLVVPFVTGLVAFATVPAPPPANETWDAFAKKFVDSYLKIHPQFAVYLGKHEFDGMLPDWSPEAFKKEVAWLHQQRESIQVFDQRNLDSRRHLEYDVLLTRINSDLFWLEDVKQPYRDPTFYSLDPSVYVTRAYAPLETRLAAYVRFAAALPKAVSQIRENLHPPLARPFIDIGEIVVGGYESYCQNDVPAAFAGAKDKSLQRKFTIANEEAMRALNSLKAWLGQQRSTANDSFALGPRLFGKMLQVTEHVDLPLADLQNIGEQDLERNLTAMREACAQYAPGKSVEECVQMVDADKPKGNLLEAAREQLNELKQFVSTQKIASIPGTEEAYVEESPPYMRWNSASINIPGPFEKGLPSRYYITLPDSSWSEKAREEYVPGKATLLFTSVHEVWPGHFLQHLHERQCPSDIGKMFGSYAFGEGWAHYTEEMIWDAGLHKGDPEARIGQLKEALLRNVRYLSALGLHTGTMTIEQSDRMFREKAFQDSANAHQQALRGTFDPGYLNYTLGKLMIRQLRDDWCATRGGRNAWGQFHDAFLSYGSPPIPLVRSIMLGDKSGPLLKTISQ